MKIEQLSVLTMPGCSLGIGDWRILFTMQNSLANVW